MWDCWERSEEATCLYRFIRRDKNPKKTRIPREKISPFFRGGDFPLPCIQTKTKQTRKLLAVMKELYNRNKSGNMATQGFKG